MPDGRMLLATGSADRTVRLWDPATGTPVGDPLTGHTDWVRSVAAVPMPDGRMLLATGSDDSTVRLWRIRVRETSRQAPALSPVPSTWISKVRRAAARPPGPPLVAVLEGDTEHVATLSANPLGWVMLAADGRTYKTGGDTEDLLWWVIKSVRFEAGELDPYDPTITRLDPDVVIV
jgi:WD40 repeat protein